MDRDLDGVHPDPLRRAWFSPLRQWLVASDPRTSGQLDLALMNRFAAERGLRTEVGRELRFVDARTMLREPYEVAIRDHGAIATRLDGPGMVHDWCNALAWLAFPRTKARLNALHTHPVAAAGSKAHRSPLRDAATLFDESGAYIVYRSGAGAACGDVWPVDALRALDWPALFVAGRQRFRRDVRVLVVGHALFEKLLDPYKSVCAHAWCFRHGAGDAVPADVSTDELEAAGSGQLCAEALRTVSLVPLPLLGVPDWWPANEDPTFYDDARVFRRSRADRRRIRPGAGRTIAGGDARVAPEEGPDSTGQDAG